MRCVRFILMGALAALGAPVAAQSPAGGCSEPASRQFDFWIGDWDVYARTAPDKLVAHSEVKGMFGGCVVRETWAPLVGGGGGSFSAYQANQGWKQTWVDAFGAWVEFRGAAIASGMVLQGVWPQPGKPDQLTRMTYRRLDPSQVEQIGETSDDGGRSWQPSFDFIYRPSAARSR